MLRKHSILLQLPRKDILYWMEYYNDVPAKQCLVVQEQLRDKAVTETHNAVFLGHLVVLEQLRDKVVDKVLNVHNYL